MCSTETSKGKNTFRRPGAPPPRVTHSRAVPAFIASKSVYAEEATRLQRCRPASAPPKRTPIIAHPRVASDDVLRCTPAVPAPRSREAQRQQAFESLGMSK
eukprot:TRINITY_DN36000_c0_g1_i1.p1 TRINITY_DN36000_c0_g1~~TRINITY_DN36000_c0_g1_i1.p1  ORF type:complete len:101 (+),score=6.72 TRINITY_DN36000_c0_g1_i1:70-372(+)